MICTNYVNLYDIKIEFFWDVKPCTLVDLRQSAGDFSTSRVAVYVSSDHRWQYEWRTFHLHKLIQSGRDGL